MHNASFLKAGFLVTALLFSKPVIATETQVLDFDFEMMPMGYVLGVGSSANATANLQIGDIGGSNGLIFDGTWDVPANGREAATGALTPEIPTVSDFQIFPADVDGIVSLRYTADLAVTSNTMVPPNQGLFSQLVIYQQQADGSIETFFGPGTFVVVGESVSVDIVRFESDFGSPGNRPDFSPSGRPFSVGLYLSAQYPRELIDVPFFLDGRMTADNWKVFFTGGLGGVLKDGFEEDLNGPTEARRAPRPANEADCNCMPAAVGPQLKLN